MEIIPPKTTTPATIIPIKAPADIPEEVLLPTEITAISELSISPVSV